MHNNIYESTKSQHDLQFGTKGENFMASAYKQTCKEKMTNLQKNRAAHNYKSQ
jgi:hypothetical protein